MSREEIIQLITENIYPNGNNEITANVLNPVLDAMVNQINDITGDLTNLATEDTSNLVNAINSVITQFEGIDSNSVKLHSGIDNPNENPPAQYNTADFYIQQDSEGNPLYLWQFNGIRWNKENAENDRFTSLGTLVKEGNEITLGLGYAWIIDDILYSNSVEQEFIIQDESTGQSRVDIIVTFGNGFSLIQGLPSAGEGTAIKPNVPIGSLELTQINIYEDNISEIIDPYLGAPYVTKISQSFIDYTANNADNGIPFDSLNGRSKFALTSATPYVVPAYVLDASNLSTVSLATDMPVVFYNLGAGHIYKHNDTSIPFGMPFIFPDGQNFTAAQGSVISFLPINGQLIFDNYSIISEAETPSLNEILPVGNTGTLPIILTLTNASQNAFDTNANIRGSFIYASMLNGRLSLTESDADFENGTSSRIRVNRKIYYDGAGGISVPISFTGREVPDWDAVTSVTNLKANDADVLHKTGNEVKENDLTFTSGTIKTATNFGIDFNTTSMRYGIKYDTGLGGFNLVRYGVADGIFFIKDSNTFVGINNITPTEQLDVVGNGKFSGVLYLGKFTTGTEPTYQQGAIYYNTSINKIKFGGATGWEVLAPDTLTAPDGNKWKLLVSNTGVLTTTPA